MNVCKKVLPYLAVIVLCDFHWAIMQVLTWTEMAAHSVSREESVITTVIQSVTGEKKCPHCVALEKERERDDERSLQWESKTLGLSQADQNRALVPPLPYHGIVVDEHDASSRRDEPETPPPWS